MASTDRSRDASAAPSWRDQAVARSLDSARVRAEHRVQRFLDAALELMNENENGSDFTVQEVVERSGQSLRSFYQYFGGKQELLLALFEESVRSTADHLEGVVGKKEDPRARLHAFVVEYYRICHPTSRSSKRQAPTRALAELAQQLLLAHPDEAARAFDPLIDVFERVLAEAEEAGVIRAGLPRRRTAGVVLESTMITGFATTGGTSAATTSDPAEDLFDLVFLGIGAN